jgi:hypothetical protein
MKYTRRLWRKSRFLKMKKTKTKRMNTKRKKRKGG